MDKATYLEQPCVADFTAWLAEVISDTRCIDFSLPDEGRYRTFSDAIDAYRWPLKCKRHPSRGAAALSLQAEASSFDLARGSSLEDNDRVLKRLRAGLLKSMKSKDEAAPEPWVAAILAWGGVYTYQRNGQGNKGWLEAKRHQLKSLLACGCKTLRRNDDDLDLFECLRFNAGMSKVYSLLLDDFVIYDSRVAAGLGWLVWKWSRAKPKRQPIPDLLRFACPPGKGNKLRRPSDDFPVLWHAQTTAGHYAHWNLRANWVLSRALEMVETQGGSQSHRENLREVEAGLFMLGDDLSGAI